MNKKCRKLSEKSTGESTRLSLKRNVECKCPKCQKVFQRNMVWTGKLPARKFCDNCSLESKNYFDNSYLVIFS